MFLFFIPHVVLGSVVIPTQSLLYMVRVPRNSRCLLCEKSSRDTQ